MIKIWNTKQIFSRMDTTLHPALSICRSVGQSVSWSHFTLSYDFYFWTSLHLPKWSSDLKYGPCPPARDLGSRVSGLVFSRGWGLFLKCH